jgi:hypothetical protein
MADHDELAMLRSSVRQAAMPGGSEAPAASELWARVRSVGWEAAFLPGAEAVGAAEAVAVAEECGRQAAPLPVPGLLVGLLAALRASEAGDDGFAAATADDAVVLWAAVLPSASWTSSARAPGDDDGVDVVVPGFELATHLLVTTHEPDDRRAVLWRTHDLAPSAVSVESLDGAVPTRVVRLDDTTRVSALAHAAPSDAELDLWRDLSMLVASAQAIGLLDRALAATVEYACDRTAFGRPIGAFQAVKHMLADTKMVLECSRAMVADAVQRVDDRDASAPLAVAGTARFVGRKVLEGLQLCVQVHGGIGITMESELHHLVRRATTLRFLHLEPFASGRRIVELHARGEAARV